MQLLILGAGRSSFFLIDYLYQKQAEFQYHLHICDSSEMNLNFWKNKNHISTQQLDIENSELLSDAIERSFLVISLLPAQLHFQVAGICLQFKKHLVTASYVSHDMKTLHESAKQQGLTFLNELGLDPGIDHLSAMKIMDEIKLKGNHIVSFESYCGGLIAEEDCGENPWKYKFSWNPRNVVLSGQGGLTSFRKNGEIKYHTPNNVFARNIKIPIPNLGTFDAYCNRDSLGYETIYGLENIQTMIRGTLRRNYYCDAWFVLVKLGFTNNDANMNKNINSPKKFAMAFTNWDGKNSFSNHLVEKKLCEPNLQKHIDFLNFESELLFAEKNRTPAEFLQELLMKKWELQADDKDEIVMFHRIGFVQNNSLKYVTSTMNLIGTDSVHTAMAKTVGLPLAMGTELILKNNNVERGVVIPTSKNWYVPILQNLENYGIVFSENEHD